MKTHFIYLSLAACVTLAVASAAVEDRVGLSDGTIKPRGLAPAAVNARRQFEWLYDEDEIYDDYGDFDTWVSDNVAKRRALPPADPKDKRQFEWLYDEDEIYDDYGDIDTGTSDNAAKAKAKR